MMNWWDTIPWLIGMGTLGHFAGKFIRWCWFTGKGKVDVKNEGVQLKAYKEYYDARRAYFDIHGTQKEYNVPEWYRIERAEEAIVALGGKK